MNWLHLYFSDVTLLFGQQEGHPACKCTTTAILKNSLLKTSITWSNSGKWIS